MTTTSASQSSKALNKKELKRFQEMLEEKRKVVVERARQMLSEGMVLDANDLPDEMDLASSEYIQSFEFRLRGREKSLLSKLDLALKKIDDGTFGICEIC
ncbi:MAG TPA: conjugal transfer protein TraR, partial [Kofleriaceae bacterium]|nr:conjugal transfer protein TraR [Kofleriaceae bacterium]